MSCKNCHTLDSSHLPGCTALSPPRQAPPPPPARPGAPGPAPPAPTPQRRPAPQPPLPPLLRPAVQLERLVRFSSTNLKRNPWLAFHSCSAFCAHMPAASSCGQHNLFCQNVSGTTLGLVVSSRRETGPTCRCHAASMCAARSIRSAVAGCKRCRWRLRAPSCRDRTVH